MGKNAFSAGGAMTLMELSRIQELERRVAELEVLMRAVLERFGIR